MQLLRSRISYIIWTLAMKYQQYHRKWVCQIQLMLCLFLVVLSFDSQQQLGVIMPNNQFQSIRNFCCNENAVKYVSPLPILLLFYRGVPYSAKYADNTCALLYKRAIWTVRGWSWCSIVSSNQNASDSG